jgi:hypothetical protein
MSPYIRLSDLAQADTSAAPAAAPAPAAPAPAPLPLPGPAPERRRGGSSMIPKFLHGPTGLAVVGVGGLLLGAAACHYFFQPSGK